MACQQVGPYGLPAVGALWPAGSVGLQALPAVLTPGACGAADSMQVPAYPAAHPLQYGWPPIQNCTSTFSPHERHMRREQPQQSARPFTS